MKLRKFIASGFMATLIAPEILKSMSASLPIGMQSRPVLKSPPLAAALVSISSDGENWFSEKITQEQLDGAIYNPQTGQRELIVSMEVPDNGGTYQFANVIGGQVTGVFTGKFHDPYQSNFVCMMIVAIVIIVVGGVIIYQLVRLCQKLSNPPNNNKDQP